ncbi:TonB-dependent siderophore receptor [Achromobacter marplatensis]|uniref:TonB-dependent siderophore receptor n=1 Tax=Achromobacter marplatensis TaxID=470868 RepID=A0AA42WG64_9BURK|nr:TonB-dependent siderophore receptor [Achromobacter marplatensis]MDH2053004.1 TonB-dependent siderophore receptor [Achromobacter marplatensis]
MNRIPSGPSTRAAARLALPTRGLTVLAVSVLLALAIPQPAAQAQEAPLSLNIPAQSLEGALTQLATQAALELAYAPDTVRGMKAPAVSGTLTPDQALRALLAGTGLVFERSGSSVSVSRQAEGDTSSVMLNTITVVGKGNSITEDTGSYTTGAMNTATKLPLTIQETPQSVSVVTRQKLDDFAMQTIDDVANSTTGVTVNHWSNDRSRYFSRGFTINTFLMDGLPVSYETDTSTYSTTAMYDHVEVVRGPTGLMTGMGDPSGTINFVRKQPTDAAQFIATARAGSWNNFSGEFDASGPLNDSGSVRGRFVTSQQSRDYFTDGYSSRKQLYYGVVDIDITDNTTLTLGGHSNREDNPGSEWMGVPTAPDGSPLDIRRSRRFSPSWSYWDKSEYSLFAELKHTFDNGWIARAAARGVNGKSSLDGAYFVSGDYDAQGGIVYDVMGGRYDYDKKQRSFDVSAQGPIMLFGREHEIAVGASYRNDKWLDNGYSYLDEPGGYLMVSGVNPYTWNPDSLRRQAFVRDTMWRRDQRSELTSGYATGRFSLADPLSMILGARMDWFDFDNKQTQGSWSSHRKFGEDAHFTPYAALIYDLNDNHSVYASYSSIFKPQYYLDTSGTVIKPVEGTNYEIGLKGSYLDERVNAAIALFSTTQTNLPQAVTDIASCFVATNCYRAVGEVKSEGVEIDINGELLPRLNVGIGYSYTRAKVSSGGVDGAAGQPYASYIPQHQFKLAAMYHLPGAYEKWRVGGALRAQSKITTQSLTGSAGYVIKQSPYALVDLVAGYRVNRQLDIQLNVNNLFDKRYFESMQGNNGGNYYGTPRSFLLSTRYQF